MTWQRTCLWRVHKQKCTRTTHTLTQFSGNFLYFFPFEGGEVQATKINTNDGKLRNDTHSCRQQCGGRDKRRETRIREHGTHFVYNAQSSHKSTRTPHYVRKLKWNGISIVCLPLIFRFLFCCCCWCYLSGCSVSLDFASDWCWCCLVILSNWWLLWNSAAIRCAEMMAIYMMETSPKQPAQRRTKNQFIISVLLTPCISAHSSHTYLGGIACTRTRLCLMHRTLRLLP